VTLTREYRATANLEGPFPATSEDITELNAVFSEAFTDRYRRDGLLGVRVPPLNPAIWRYAVQDAGEGALVWRNTRGEIVAFNMVHLSGTEGWMGPLAVRPDWQGNGVGKVVVRTGIEWLKARGARVIGLETMPRTVDNIGFYSTLGFVPGHLTLTVWLPAALADEPVVMLSQLDSAHRERALDRCRDLTKEQLPGYDFAREIELTAALGLGDTLLLVEGDELRGFALFHSVPLVEGRGREELRVLKLVLRHENDVEAMVRALAVAALHDGTKSVAVRVQTAYRDSYRRLLRIGARVRWSDLRMTIPEYSEVRATSGVVFSNWEI
jgi:predicted N-acetyltransferase YhbS